MSWMRKAGAIALAVALVVLIPAPGASAAQVTPPVDPWYNLPSTTVKGTGAGVLDGSKSWAQAWAEVQRDVVKSGKPVASPLTQADKIVRNAATGLRTNVLGNGFLAGFAVGSAGVRVYSMFPGNDALPGVCGSGLELASSLLYPDLMKDCSVPYAEGHLNEDTTSVEAGFPQGQTLSGATTFGGGTVTVKVSNVHTLTPFGATLGAGTYQPVFYTLTVTDWTCPTTPNKSVGEGAYGLVRRTSTGAVSTSGSNVSKLSLSPVCVAGGTGDMELSSSIANFSATSAFTFYGMRFTLGGETINWYPQGASEWTPAKDGDPLRNASCRVTMSDGSVRDGFVGQYRESEGFPVGAVAAACTDAMGDAIKNGLLPDSLTLTSTNPDTGQTSTIATQDVPDFTESEKVGLTPGDNTGLRLLKVVNGVTQSCMTWEAACVGWWTKTSSGTVGTTDEGTYRCEYGGREVALAECGVYRQTFDTQTENPTVTDPVTGAQQDWSSSPDPANNYGTGAQSNQSNDRCVTSFSWNPVDWVLRPIRCAFEPRQSKLDQFQSRINNAWRLSFPGRLSASVGTIGVAFEGMGDGSCGGVIVPFPEPNSDGSPRLVNRAFLPACSGDLFAPVAPLFFWLFSAVIVVTGVFGVRRQLDKFVGNS